MTHQEGAMNRAEPLTYSVDEVAELLGIARGVAYECVRNGSIRPPVWGVAGLFRVSGSMRGWRALGRPRRLAVGMPTSFADKTLRAVTAVICRPH